MQEIALQDLPPAEVNSRRRVMDNFFDHAPRPRYYEDVDSYDLEHGQDLLSSVTFPVETRRGAIVVKVPKGAADKQQLQEINQQTKP